MCDSWKKDYSSKFNCNDQEMNTGVGEYTVTGHLDGAGNSNILFWAPNPPTYSSSFSGSGLPYPNANIAYENTPNRGMVKAENGNYQFKVRFPNAYYAGLGTKYIEPCCHIKICGSDEIHTIPLNHGIPYRTLTYPEFANRTSPTFYDGGLNLPVRTQEQILRDSGYPETNKKITDFWGTRPRV